MKNHFNILKTSLFLFLFFVVGTASLTVSQSHNFLVLGSSQSAQASGLVPCGTQSVNGVVSNPCGWNDFMILITNITNYLIILGAGVSALAFGYAGFLMLTASGEMGKIEEARAIFKKVVIGFLIMLSAWLIVHTIESAFVINDSFTSLLSG